MFQLHLYSNIRIRIADVGIWSCDFQEREWTGDVMGVLSALSWSGFEIQKTFNVEWSSAIVSVMDVERVPYRQPGIWHNVFSPYSCLTDEPSFDYTRIF